ncbi:tetratricopeptide repeat protein [Clostridium sp.]|uniref:tetratricopeptide repeat protein n=1 Tax=Clostridium sp. TaxID=1506 RepID=UPI003463F4E1
MKSVFIEIGVIFFIFIVISGINPIIGKFVLFSYLFYKFITKRYIFYSVKGSKLYRNGNKEEAIKYFEKASNISTCKPRIHISYSYLLLVEGRLEDAERILGYAAKSKLYGRENLNAKITLALIEWKKDNLDESINILEELLKESKSMTLYESLGYLLLLKGDYERALDLNLEAKEYDSSSSIILDNLAQSYYNLGKIKEAEEIYEDITKINLTFADPYYYYGLILKEKGDLDEAKDMFLKALSCPESFLTGLNKSTIEKELDYFKDMSVEEETASDKYLE